MLDVSLPASLTLAATATPAATPGASNALAPLLPGVLVLLLCAVAGIGTVLLLPGKREITIGRVGGALLAVTGIIFFALLFRAAVGSSEQAPTYFFWPFAAVALVGGVRVITHPRPVYAALYFVLTTFATAGLFVLLWAEFMAAALILIYAGAILVTYVFVIMLAQHATGTGEKAATTLNEYDAVSREPVVAATVGFALMAVLLFVILDKATVIPKADEIAIARNNEQREFAGETVKKVNDGQFTQTIGRHLFQYHMVNLELAGLLLTVATVGAILIARRRIVLDAPVEAAAVEVVGPATPIDDNPHSIPVYGTDNPRQKAYPET